MKSQRLAHGWSKWGPWLVLGLILLLYNSLRELYAHVAFFSVDEAVSAVLGRAIMEGGLPYRDAVDHRGPLTYYFYAGIFRMWGAWNMYMVHQVYVWMQLGLLLLVYRLGSIWNSRWMGVWAAGFMAFHTYASPFYEMWAAHTEWLLTVFAGLGYLVYLLAPGEIGQGGKRRGMLLILSGICFGMGALSKQVGALEAGGIGLYLLLELGIRQGKWKALLGEVGLMLIGFLIPWGGMFLQYAAAGALTELWLFGWYYNTAYYVPVADWATRIEGSVKMVVFFFYNKALSAALFVGSLWLLPWGNFRQRSQPLSLIWMLFGWALISLCESLIGGRTFIHYMIQFLVPLSLLCAWALMQVYEQVAARRNLFWAGSVAGVLMLIMPIVQHWSLNSFLMVEDISITEYVEVAEYVQSQTQPEDRIFVWGFSPQIYVLSERRPATRFNYCNMLVGHVPAITSYWETTDELIMPEAWERLWQDLDQHPPAYIVEDIYKDQIFSGYQPEQYPFGTWRDRYYECDTTFLHPVLGLPFDVWKRKPSHDDYAD